MSLEDAELRAARALAHPLRLRILSLLTGIELSAAEVARELDITQANASYHLRRLAAAGELEVASTEKIRGGVAKKYRYVARVDTPADIQHRPSIVRLEHMRQAVDAELRRRIPLADEGPRIFADAEVWLPPEVLDEVHALIARASMLAHEQALPPRTPGAKHVSLLTWLFGMGDDDEAR
ncbi:helix-turn-helix transcriptional regulator [Yimella sp. cx-573]|nr:helix-turn-helix transcriptional regulator [Yimella sp. cx-573]